MRRTTIALLASSMLVLGAAPALADDDRDRSPEAPNIVEVVLTTSGDVGSGFDERSRDFDILREALVATGLVDAVATSSPITVFAPNDRAMIRLARDLGYDGFDEEGAFGAIAAATGYVSPEEPGLLDDVLLYHVAPERLKVRDLYRGSTTTLQGGELELRRFRVIDADPDNDTARVTFPWFVPAANGNIVVISEVLRPIDL